MREALAPAPAKIGNFPAAPKNPLTHSVGIEEAKTANEVLFVGAYPNPVWDVVNVGLSVNDSKTVELQLLSVDGKVISNNEYTLNPGHHKIELEMSDLPKGIYFLQISSHAKSLYQKRLVKK